MGTPVDLSNLRGNQMQGSAHFTILRTRGSFVAMVASGTVHCDDDVEVLCSAERGLRK